MARKILLADDSVTAQNMGRKILTDAGYEVITVNNGSAALKRVGEHKPDLIVLDVYMPGYSGLEVCQRLKDSPETSRIPILLTVGKLEPFKPEEARRVNADAFIVKPFEASELLSALTRLEDRMVPQADGTRFTTSVSGIERFGADAGVGFGKRNAPSADETDTGWKNRIRFPSEKKKAPEPEPEEDFGVTPFRDFKRGTSKPHPASGQFAVSAAVPQEPGLVPDIPRDITPDELDALSALAAKLDGPIPESEDIVPVGGKIGPPETPAPSALTKTETEPATPIPEAKAAAEPAVANAAVEASPAAQSADSTPAAATPPQPETTLATTPAAPESATAVPDLTPAPVDRQDEPIFASAPSPSSEVAADEKSEVTAEEVKAEEAPVEAAIEPTVPVDQLKIEEPIHAAVPPKVEEVHQETPAASSSEPPVSEPEHVPTEEELAEALRLLTPSHPLAETPSATRQEEPVTIPADVVQAVERAGQGAGLIGSWVAEAVALSPEEASVSLEAEMFQKFSMSPVAEAPAAAASAVVEPSSAIAETPSAEATPEVVASAPAAAEAEPKQAEPPAAEEEPATTFADAIQQAQENETESGPSTSAEVAAAPEFSQTSSSEEEARSEESMGKDNTKSGKSGWHQIRSVSAPAPAASDPVQAAKEAAAEETPKAMAAAAAGDGGSASDASAIASIVDSVLADLRPKIVEEIAKKLGKK